MRLSVRRSLAVACALASSARPAAAQTFADARLQASVHACCPQWPTSFAFLPVPPAQPVEVLILEKFTGRVQHYRGGTFVGTALDLPVSSYAERGLLGIALHPDFGSNGFVYLYYTSSPTGMDTGAPDQVVDNRVVRFTWDGALLASPQVILQLPGDTSFVHIGGAILFGPDARLYGILGDVGRFGRLQNIASGNPPDDTSIIFRVQDDGTAAADNPFYALGGAMQKVYAFGIRNSFGIEFDPVSGVLWQSENGTSQYDEVNRVLPGFNSGWVRILGPDARSPAGLGDLWYPTPDTTYSDPEFSWLAQVAPTAVHFLRSDSLGAESRHDLFIGAYNTRSIYRFELTPDRSDVVLPAASVFDRVADSAAERDLFLWASGFPGGVVDLDTGPDGALYVLVFENGRLIRIAPARTSDAPAAAPGSLVAFPNPFAAGVHILGRDTASLPTLHVFDVAGRRVATLPGGGRTAFWDGRDAHGRAVAAGLYHVRLGTPGTPDAATRIVRTR